MTDLLDRLLPFERRKVAAMDYPQKFRYFALKLIGASYILGTENLLSTDCSGTLTIPLYACGFKIRMTADGLFNTVFVRDLFMADWERCISAVFFRKAGARRVTHVSPIVGRGVVLDAWDPTERVILKALEAQKGYYQQMGYTVLLRSLDMDLARGYSSEDFAGELDRELMEVLT